jgi:DNA polymerase/3'-5' exonuclease PolX
MSAKPKFPAAVALDVARDLCRILRPVCALDAQSKPLLICAGSLRRKKAEVGDLELLYVPAFGLVGQSLFPEIGNLIDEALADLLERGILSQRLNQNGVATWGVKNKYAVHAATGLPVDLFAIEAPAWWNYVVCRTGSAANNTRSRGLTWHPYREGFEVISAELASLSLGRDLLRGEILTVTCEEDVFSFAGLPYLNPSER